jgi:hypothetical protein
MSRLSISSSTGTSTRFDHEPTPQSMLCRRFGPHGERASSTTAPPMPGSMPPPVQRLLLHRVGPLLPFLQPSSLLALSRSTSTALNFPPSVPNCPVDIHLHHSTWALARLPHLQVVQSSERRAEVVIHRGCR